MYTNLFLPLTLLLSLVTSEKICFNSTNEVILDDPYFGKHIGNITRYTESLDESEKQSEFVGGLRAEVRNTKVGTIKQSYYNALISGTTYCNDDKLYNWTCKHCKMLGDKIKLYKIIHEPVYQTKMVIYLDTTDRKIILAFRGSTNINNWVENLRMDRTPFPVVEDGEVHHGFKNMIDRLFIKFNPEITALRTTKYKGYDVVFTGHSLGGALSVLGSIYLEQEQQDLEWSKIATYTYGQPRVGNLAFALWYNSLDTTITRVVNSRDVVPHIPPMAANYRHLFTEMLTVKDTTYICNTEYLEDDNCSNWYVPFLTLSPHLSVWDIELGTDVC